MGVVGPEGMSQLRQFNAVRCLTAPGVRLRHKGPRGKCLTGAATPGNEKGPRRFHRGPLSLRRLGGLFSAGVGLGLEPGDHRVPLSPPTDKEGDNGVRAF